MFTDEAEIYLKAGNGGNGAVSFRREKYIPNGGPDGGDGGRGGDIIFKVEETTHGLLEFKKSSRYLAENGQGGMGKNRSGKNGEDLTLIVPPGTQIWQKGELVCDFQNAGEEIVFLKGGKGGWGNQHFATSIKQAPQWAKEGMKGESAKITLVLKTIADVGLIGLPNAGKSTLLASLTNAKPKIADYPFTTLTPNLGIYRDKDSNIIFADIPGLVEGAHTGKGLGDRFLRHIERTKILVHLLDANSPDLLHDYETIRTELSEFSKELCDKKEIVAVNKADSVEGTELQKKVKKLSKAGVKPLVVSAATHQNLDQLIGEIKLALSKL